MASRIYEIRWINSDKKYGLFATQRIPAGTKILNEWAVMVNAEELINTVDLWTTFNQQEVSFSETRKSALRTKTDQILSGMQNLREVVQINPMYKPAMDIHKARMTEEQPPSTNIGVTITHLPADLYKRFIDPRMLSASDDVLNILLRKPLQSINSFLQNSIQVHQPQLHTWGPIVSLLNHGCKPRAYVTIQRTPDDTITLLKHIGMVALRSTTDIEEGQEITIEYEPALGTYEQRRDLLRSFGIDRCHCDNCDYEANLFDHQPRDQALEETLSNLTHRGEYLHTFYDRDCEDMHNLRPVEFFHKLYEVFTALVEDDYCGVVLLRLYDIGIIYCKYYNDNLRIYWLTSYLLDHVAATHGQDHIVFEALKQIYDDALAGRLWNEHDHTDLLTCTTEFQVCEDDTELIFMLSSDPNSSDYHQLAVNAEGRPSPVTKEANLAIVRQKNASRGVQFVDQSAPPGEAKAEAEREMEALAMAGAAADNAAANLIAAEEEEAARKARAQAKRKRKVQRKKEKEQAKKEIEEKNLAARAAAARAATVIPALPLPRSATTKPTVMTTTVAAEARHPPRPCFARSSSCPEWATIARFLASELLRAPSSEFRDQDCVSEGGMEIRFGVKVWNEETEGK